MRITLKGSLRIAVSAFVLNTFFSSVRAGEDKTVKVADMEKKIEYKAFPIGKPKVSFSSKTASQGKKSLRFEFTGYGKDRADLYFPFQKDVSGYDTLVFDFYCENNNGSTMIAHVGEKVNDPKKETADSYARVNLMDGRDGWTTVRLKKGKNFEFRGKGSPDWSKVERVTFGFGKGMQGKMVVYFDNIRFEKSKDGDASANLLYNSSFEKTTSPGTPDGWHRDLHIPPFGKNIWGIDESTAFDGKNSLRIGLKGKYLASMNRFSRLTVGQIYTFSVYMKSDKDDANAVIKLSGIKMPGKKKSVKIGKEWKRYSATGKAKSVFATCQIELDSDNAAIWIDAAQLVEGEKPLPYKAPVTAAEDEGSEKKLSRERLNKKTVSVKIKKAVSVPVIDGVLDEECWKKAVPMKSFVKYNENVPADDKTVAKMTFGENALYISVIAEEKDMPRVKKMLDASKRGPWGTDLIEVFIDFNNDMNSYYQFAANAKGEKYAARLKSPRQPVPWDCEWSAAGKLLDNAWTVEMKIPYTCFDLSKFSDAGEMGINICRTSLGEPKSYSAWSYPYGGFHSPRAFGVARGFQRGALKPFLFDIVSLDWRRGKALAALKNRTGEDVDLKLNFNVIAPDESKMSSDAISKKVKAGASCEIAAPLSLAKDGLYKLSVSGIDGKGLLRVASQNVEIRVAGASLFDFQGSEFDFYTSDKKARARCFIDADPKRCRGLTLRWALKKSGASVVKSGNISLSSGINEWSVPLEGLDNGEYELLAELFENGKSVDRKASVFRKLPPAKQEVRINRWGRFLVQNGAPVFLYGFYDDNVGRGDLKTWIDVLEDAKKAHCTAHMVYMGNNPDVHKNIGKYLDAAQKSGQKIWVHLSGMFAWHIKKYALKKKRYFSEEEAMKGLRSVVLKYKDHPALIGWCTLDEPGNRPHIFTEERVGKYYKAVKELDPYHPCALSHVTHLGESKVYGDATDCAFIPYLPRGGRYDYLFQEFWNIGKPIITNTPCYGGIGNKKREPTPAEQRIGMYKAIILGARGLCSYTYRPAGQALWDEFIEIGKEIEYLSPVLLSPDNKLCLEISPKGQDIYAVLKRHKDKYFLIAVNTAPYQVEAGFRLVDIPGIANAKALFGTKPAELDKKLKKIKVKMDRQSTVVYEIIQN